ncbi:helix-turn-helix domain-containing protein [Photobacterium damselae]|uniref:helix-turn-helix domain-containing protein n=2 Tax=Photobacterium damselae TaxID=38293 RepID=UPI0040693EC5
MFSVSDTCEKLKISRATLYRRMEINAISGFTLKGKKYFTEHDVNQLKSDKKHNNDKLVNILSLLSDKIDLLSLKIDSLASDIDTIKSEGKKYNCLTVSESKAVNRGNEKRAEQTKNRLFKALDSMSDIPMYRGKPSIAGIHKETGIDRGAIAKYLPQWIEENL